MIIIIKMIFFLNYYYYFYYIIFNNSGDIDVTIILMNQLKLIEYVISSEQSV